MENNGSIFTSVKKKRERRSSFNLSHDVKLSLDMGYVVPTLVQECVPGDKFKINSSSMLRMAPLVSPVMHKINVHMEYFFVPNRILWENWETFITGSKNGKQLPADQLPAFPVVQPWDETKFINQNGSLSDYLGIPTPESFVGGKGENANVLGVNALPFAAYQRIWDEYYRDENLVESIYEIPNWYNYNMLRDGIVDSTVQGRLSTLRPRAWEHDYFTSALPWAQKGEEVTIPMDLSNDNTLPTVFRPRTDPDGTSFSTSDPTSFQFSAAPDQHLQTPLAGGGTDSMNIDVSEQMTNAATINDLRAAIKLQEWLETNARGGSRYFESIYAHFGVQSPDSRLQRPEFIGSHRSNMIISEVLQTSSPQGENDTPQGNMSGHGSNVSQSRNYSYYCQEHGYIIGMISVLPKTAYFQGVEKHWLKYNDRLDYYFPEFAHLGEQEISNMEIWFNTSPVNDYDPFGTFGYTPRYAEYKFKNSRVAGDFRDTLKYWHLGRDFETPAFLNDSFITADPSKRIFAVQDLPRDNNTDPNNPIRDYHSIYAHVFHDIKATRLMPKYGTPTL
ncbi:major capsid protein [Microviridae sp.]|nr:major capsid protein [Microviridae sp.]